METDNLEKKMQEAEKILESYLGGTNDNKIPATVGILTAGRTKELTISLENLNKTIQKEVANIIESNKKLADSNNRHVVGMKWLTIALVIVGVVQVIVSWINIDQTKVS